MNVAIITAGGIGTRMKLGIPKQFYVVNKKPLIQYTLDVFEKSESIDLICLVYLEGYREYFENLIRNNSYKKIKVLVPGGSTNQLSIFEGLKGLMGLVSNNDVIIVHDGIRPLVDENVIRESVSVCKKYGNAVAVIPSNEAMLYSNDSDSSTTSLDRSKVWKTQTPHAMHYSDMVDLLKATIAKGVTDSVAVCTMLIENGKTVHFSKGNSLNFKLTTQEDIVLFKAVLQSKK